MWFKNAQLYRLPENYALHSDQLDSALRRMTFLPCTSLQLSSSGWVPPRTGDQLFHVVNKQYLLMFVTEKKVLPPSYIDKELEKKVAKIAQEQGYPAGRKQRKEIREQVIDELLPRAMTNEQRTAVWIDPIHGWLTVDSTNATRAGEIIKALIKCIDNFPVKAFRVNRSPISAMTRWLAEEEEPYSMTVDQEAELLAPGEGKATVKYVRHSLDNDDVRNHIAAGKQCVRLALTWKASVSFTLTDGMCLRKLSQTDVLKQSRKRCDDADEEFDADFFMMCEQLSALFVDLAENMGGETATDQSDWVQQQVQGKVAESSAAASEAIPPAPQDLDTPDDLYEKAVEVVLSQNRASISLIQRHLRIGYNRAARLLDQMELQGVVSAADTSGARHIHGRGPLAAKRAEEVVA